jgi:nucleoid DNA-binding protein
MARDWEGEAAAVIVALVERGAAEWPGIGSFRVVEKPAGAGSMIRRVSYTPTEHSAEAFVDKTLPRIKGFGVFQRIKTRAYEGRDPGTGQMRSVEAGEQVLFSSSAELLVKVAKAPIGDEAAS